MANSKKPKSKLFGFSKQMKEITAAIVALSAQE